MADATAVAETESRCLLFPNFLMCRQKTNLIVGLQKFSHLASQVLYMMPNDNILCCLGAEKVVKELHKQGIVVPCTSPTNFPMWLVRKPDRSWRLTINYTALNAVSPKVHPLLANPATILHEIGLFYCFGHF